MRKLSKFTEAEWDAYHEDQRRKARIWGWASKQVKEALATGTLVRPDACAACGRTDCKIEAAHHDYTKPLDVRFLCLSCHRSWDAAKPKTPAHDLIPRQRPPWWAKRGTAA